MARAIRKNVMLKLGVLNAPVDVSKATDSRSGPKQFTCCISGHEPAKTTMKLLCRECANDDRSTFVKAVETDDGLVVLAQEVIDSAGPTDEVRETISLTAHPADEVNARSMQAGNVYYLAPSKGAEEVYGLVLALLTERSDVTFIAEFAIKSKAAMYALVRYDDSLTLVELARPDTIRDAPNPEVDVPDEAIEMLSALVDKIAKPFDPHTYRDKRAEFLNEAVEAAANGETPVAAPKPKADESSIMDALAAALAE